MQYYDDAPIQNSVISLTATLAAELMQDMEVEVTEGDIKRHYSSKEVEVLHHLYKTPSTIKEIQAEVRINVQTLRKYLKKFEREGVIVKGDYLYHEGYKYLMFKKALLNRVCISAAIPIEKLEAFHFFSSAFAGKEVNFDTIVYAGVHPKNPVSASVTASSLAMAYLWYRDYSNEEFGEITKKEVKSTLEACRQTFLDQAEMLLRILNNPIWSKDKIHLLLDHEANVDEMRNLAEGFVSHWNDGRINSAGIHPKELRLYVDPMKDTLRERLEVDAD